MTAVDAWASGHQVDTSGLDPNPTWKAPLPLSPVPVGQLLGAGCCAGGSEGVVVSPKSLC